LAPTARSPAADRDYLWLEIPQKFEALIAEQARSNPRSAAFVPSLGRAAVAASHSGPDGVSPSVSCDISI